MTGVAATEAVKSAGPLAVLTLAIHLIYKGLNPCGTGGAARWSIGLVFPRTFSSQLWPSPSPDAAPQQQMSESPLGLQMTGVAATEAGRSAGPLAVLALATRLVYKRLKP